MMNRLKGAVSALALATGLAGCAGPTLQMPSVSENEARQVVVPTAPARVYYRSEAENKAMLSRVFSRIAATSGPVCRDLGADCTNYKPFYDSRDVVNAYASIDKATGNKEITVFGGLMKHVGNDAELAAVLAHEMSHHALGHNEKTTTRATVGAVLGSVLGALGAARLGIDPNAGGQLGGGLGVMAGVLPHSKDQEREADYAAAYMLRSAGYNLREAGQIWTTLNNIGAQKGQAPSGTSGFMATHPSSAEREVAWGKTVVEVQTSPTGLPRRAGGKLGGPN